MVLLLSNFESCYCFINWTDWFHKQQIWQNYDRFSCLKLFTGYKWHFWSLINKVGIIVYQYNVKWFLLYEENLSRNANEVQFYCHTKWRAQVAIYFGETNYRCRSPILKIAPTESVASLYANIAIIYLWLKIEMETSIQRAERLEVLGKTKQDLRLTQRQLVNNEKFNVWAPWGRLLLDW